MSTWLALFKSIKLLLKQSIPNVPILCHIPYSTRIGRLPSLDVGCEEVMWVVSVPNERF